MTIDQIAAEAWEEIIKRKLKYDLGNRAQFDEDCMSIIKSAIEKATERLREENRGLRGEVDGWKWVKVEDESSAAHASEQIDEDVMEGRVPPELGTGEK